MIHETIQLYPDRDDVALTTYRINEKGEMAAQGKRPAVIVLPGGGYFSCSDREAEPVALRFAAMGYHAFVLRYSTFLREGDAFESIFQGVTPRAETAHPAPVREVGMAMLKIREHADEWNVDMDRVAVCGFSAGAHNACMYSVYYDKPLVAGFLGVDPSVIRPAALIAGYTLSDYIFLKEHADKDIEMTRAFFQASNIAFLGKADYTEEDLLEISPSRLVSSSTPPAFLWATSADSLVPVQHTLRMANALAENGIPFEVHIFEEGDHGLSTANQASAIAKSQLNEDAAQWMNLCEKWLLKRFALNLPDKLPWENSVV